MSLASKHLSLQGRVQGVGFRYFTLRQAQRHQISGWVRNMPDGSVEIRAQGQPGNLQAFIEAVLQGPAFGEVHRHDERDVATEVGLQGFTIKH